MLTPQQKNVASMAALGKSSKAIAKETGLSVHTVNMHLRLAGDRIPYGGTPRAKAAIWFFVLSEETDEAA